MQEKKTLLQQIPKIDEILSDPRIASAEEKTAHELVVEAAREIVAEVRQSILDNVKECEAPDYESILDYENILRRILLRLSQKEQKSLRRILNGTGIILHTNLGRSRLSPKAWENAALAAANYSTLEYNLEEGKRGSRHDHVEKIICKITGAEAAMVVNNNASAVLLCLSALTSGRKVPVSRGELVEIGGSFRVPDIMAQSGSQLIEIGTTNKTRISDYRAAAEEARRRAANGAEWRSESRHRSGGLPEGAESGRLSGSLSAGTGEAPMAALLKVHTSNYRIIGFTEDASLTELVSLGREYGLPVIYDLGSGLMVDLKKYGVNEPTVVDSLKTGIDVILFSGDKLLGGPQAGIIAGKKEYVDQMKRHPLARVVRIDKMTLAALEETFRTYLDPERARKEIPVLAMIQEDPERLRERAERLAELIRQRCGGFRMEVLPCQDFVGGGSAPELVLSGMALTLIPEDEAVTLDRLERQLRRCEIPLIVRIFKDRIWVNLRTLTEEELPLAADGLQEGLTQCLNRTDSQMAGSGCEGVHQSSV